MIGALHQSPFRFHPAWSRIISGIDEGVYGWVALNYLKGMLLSHTAHACRSRSRSSSCTLSAQSASFACVGVRRHVAPDCLEC